MEKFLEQWSGFFKIEEWAHSQALQVAAWVLLLGWYLEFSAWFRFSDFTVNAVEEGRHLCWPFFQSCGDFYFLSQFPLINTHGLVYMLLFGLLILAAYMLITKRYVYAHMLFLLFFVWELIVMGMSMRLAVNFWYFHLLYAALFVFAPPRLVLMQVGAVLLYVFSGILKFDPSWTQGTYFTALSEGLYFFPDAMIPIATNAVIILEIVVVWGLFSSQRWIRPSVLALLTLFHMYSVVYVGYVYPTVALFTVLALFYFAPPLAWRDVLIGLSRARVGLLILIFLVGVHTIPLLIAGDARVTGEANRYRMYMFEANYQCDATVTLFLKGGETRVERSQTFFANRRCDPYAYWFFFQNQFCVEDEVERVAWTHDVSLNGSPFMRIVDVEDACSLTYDPFVHNEWIKSPDIDSVLFVAPSSPNRYPGSSI